jgi:hypothetical protein
MDAIKNLPGLHAANFSPNGRCTRNAPANPPTRLIDPLSISQPVVTLTACRNVETSRSKGFKPAQAADPLHE